LYEQRLNRTVAQAEAKLSDLQGQRRVTEELALQDAKRIGRLKQALGQPWQPQDDGFEFSDQQLSSWIERCPLKKHANAYYDPRPPP